MVSGAGAVGMGVGAGNGNGPRDGFAVGSFFPRVNSTDAKGSADNSVGGDAAAFTGTLFGSESLVGQVSGGGGDRCDGGDRGSAGVTVNPSASQSKQSGPGIDVVDEEDDGSIDGILGGVSPGGLLCNPPEPSTAPAAPGDGSGHNAPIWNDDPVWDSFSGVSLGESPVDLASQRSAFAFALGGGGGGGGGGDLGDGRGRWGSTGGDSGCENTEATPQ